jgi:predicted ATP-dependent endonuclease of OLD family
MYVRRIRVRKFRHLEDVDLGPFAQPSDASDLIALAGPNGGGKSSVLELLSFALSNTWSLSWSSVRQMPESSFEVEISITAKERDLVREYVAGRDATYGE